ncbi:MAG TPA: SRPBCC family protein [Candidatus Eremiobacteraceae bacterium]|nr:SRPBCC family protein [Candidatus Eremiobacteraceae bacterium]
MKSVCQDHVDLRVPVEQAYEFVSDTARWPMWLAFVVNVHPLDEEKIHLGSELRICMAAGKRRRQEIFEVTRHVGNAFLSFESDLSAARRIDFRFEQRGAMSRLSLAVGYPVFGGVFPEIWDALFVRPMVRRAVRESLIHVRGALDDAADIAQVRTGSTHDMDRPLADEHRVSVVAEPVQVA